MTEKLFTGTLNKNQNKQTKPVHVVSAASFYYEPVYNKLLPRSLARLFSGYPSRWGVDTNDWCLKIDRDNN